MKDLRDGSVKISRSFGSNRSLSYWVSFAIFDEPKYLITLYICWCSFKQTDIVDVSNLNRMSYWWSKHWIYDILQQLHFMDRVYKNTRYYLLNLYIIGWTIIFELSIIIMRRRKKNFVHLISNLPPNSNCAKFHLCDYCKKIHEYLLNANFFY